MKQSFFTKALLKWNMQQSRPMPWKGEKNPYLIWLSEIILQQTRVEQGLPYFEKFKAVYPTVHDLARAPEDEVMKLWEGLGYYSRARNLHSTAKYISGDLKGVFPKEYKNILALKGVGPYTAAAIASFAYGLPHAVVDGNVYRVLSRFYNIDDPIDTTIGKAKFVKLADELLDKTKPGVYNQAIMDFGATVCVPKNPICDSCPLQVKCKAYEKNKVDKLPVKSKKLIRKKRFFNYLVVKDEGNQTLIRKRVEKGIWQNLYDFPLIESTKQIELADLKKQSDWKDWIGKNKLIILPSKPFRQLLTHQEIIAVFWEVKINDIEDLPMFDRFASVDWTALANFGFPKIIDTYIKDNSLYLRL
ncbi:MAG: A/G-specific adenine glycosylase [Saprospiraceae bacterium]